MLPECPRAHTAVLAAQINSCSARTSPTLVPIVYSYPLQPDTYEETENQSLLLLLLRSPLSTLLTLPPHKPPLLSLVVKSLPPLTASHPAQLHPYRSLSQSSCHTQASPILRDKVQLAVSALDRAPTNNKRIFNRVINSKKDHDSDQILT